MRVPTDLENLDYPPGLEDCVTRGYNCVDANFLTGKLFATEDKQAKCELYQDDEVKLVSCKIPKSCVFQLRSESRNDKSTVIMQTKADYNEKMSTSISVEYTGVTFSGAANASVLYRGDLFTNDSSDYTLNLYAVSAYQIRQIETEMVLEEGFREALQKTPSGTTNADVVAWFEFFDLWGTHYLKKGTFGGWNMMEADVSTSLLQTQTDLEITAAIEAGYNGMIQKGKFSAEVAYSESKFLEEHRNEIAITNRRKGGSLNAEIPTWSSSVRNRPFLLTTTSWFGAAEMISFERFIDECNPATISDNKKRSYKHALEVYAGLKQTEDGFLASRVKVQENRSTLVRNDGFILITPENISFTSHDNSFLSISDTQSYEPECTTGCSVVRSNRTTYASSCLVPIQDKEHFYIRSDKEDSFQRWWFPLGSESESLLGKITRLDDRDPDGEIDIEVAGFFMYNTQREEKTDVAIKFTYTGPDNMGSYSMGATARGHTKVGIDQICMPVLAGGKIKVDGNGKADPSKMYFVPIAKNLLKPGNTRLPEIVYPARESGLLTVSIENVEEGTEGQASYLEIYLSKKGQGDTAGDLVLAYRIPTGKGRNMTNFVCPIQKDKFYRVVPHYQNLGIMFHSLKV